MANHYTYCTNIHPGETWSEVKKSLEKYIPGVKKSVSPDQEFGIGLRLSSIASEQLLEGENLHEFKQWLSENNCYVFTMNGFPYGSFHDTVVKDDVHTPDWTTEDRLNYSIRLFDILAELLPANMHGGVSTSPISYKYWHENIEDVITESIPNFIKLAAHLHEIKQATGKLLHLDIEPEPDGVLENTKEVVDFFSKHLIPKGAKLLKELVDVANPESVIKEHIRVCYDVCHFAVVYEKPEDVFKTFAEHGIKIGKIQVSAALKLDIPAPGKERELLHARLLPFAESTYLHQVVEQYPDDSLKHYRDLSVALNDLVTTTAREWRTHFHVPIFLSQYSELSSTQEEIIETLDYLKDSNICDHYEVETYTWDVLPENIQLELSEAIIRELKWLKEKI
ncbi:metabolite traffic protein EboE [Fulvivirga ligni]|uniref:metabolite traffic protein EboE n=1 Tax=Fulvivirga ligni TaxID=2904246 RepID=UPI001F1DFAC6|nr:metabolite traffic protein EboE [Fulvivirga ligni]UII20220.1 metabolite traffic protein EboE [Fulvivirga ligni]